MAITIESALSNLPNKLRAELLTSYNSIVTRYNAGDWEPSELNGGKFCEIVYSILKGYVDGNFPPRAKKPNRFDQACRDLEGADASKFSRSVRVHIPRQLIALYEVRNNRSVGHVGGDVDPNYMDASLVLAAVKWVLAELIRMFHNLETDEATAIVEALTERPLSAIWLVNGQRRVLLPTLSYRDKTLLLLYNLPAPAAESDLVSWTEHSNPSVYRRDVLRPLHKLRMVEYNAEDRFVVLSPLGQRYVEDHVPLTLA